MAVQPVTLTPLPEPGSSLAWLATWAPMANGDTGAPLPNMCIYADRSIQVEGTFGSGGALAAEGSNDGENFHTLTNPQGVALSLTSAGLSAITEVCNVFRPAVTAGDSTTSLTVTLLLRRTGATI